MKRSRLLLNTLKEVPSDAEVISHKLMLRAGMIRKLAAGVYDHLPFGLMAIRNVENIVREELNMSGAQEVLLPSVLPSELWEESGRWDKYGKELLRIRDRHGRDFCYGPTHEEVVTDLARKEIRSYKQLPLNIYQIQTKFRDEIRPRFGVMRSREFIMKDGYSFDTDDEASKKSYTLMYETYKRIFDRCGLLFRAVEADSGNIGGSYSHEFMVLADSGEDEIASCVECDYAANLERAETRLSDPGETAPASKNEIEQVETPEKKSVAEVAEFLNISTQEIVKTLIFETEGGVVAALVRGDHDINEAKLKKLLDSEVAVLAGEEIVREVTDAPSGFAGPVGLTVKIVADYSVARMADFVVGANVEDAHCKNVNHGRDFTVSKFADIRNVTAGDLCPRCEGTMKIDRGIEVGHVFRLGTKYSESMNAVYLDANGKSKHMVMGCYGIGIARTVAAAIEQNHDENGIIWPFSIAPFKVTVIPLNVKDAPSLEHAESIYVKLKSLGIETLLDDTKERAGAKFKDADLLGIPIQIIIGAKSLKEGNVEIKVRKTGESFMVPVESVTEKVRSIVSELLNVHLVSSS